MGRSRNEVRCPARKRRSSRRLCGKLQAAGFAEVRVASIRDGVFPDWHRSLAQDPVLLRRLHLLGRHRLLLRLDANAVYGAFDYVLASARKPLSRDPLGRSNQTLAARIVASPLDEHPHGSFRIGLGRFNHRNVSGVSYRIPEVASGFEKHPDLVSPRLAAARDDPGFPELR
jgi:hypothetical protein